MNFILNGAYNIMHSISDVNKSYGEKIKQNEGHQECRSGGNFYFLYKTQG